jgi:putative ABC transport system substrate-binding protein
MKKKIAVFAVSTLLFALCSCAEAQQQAKVPRIGFLTNNSPTTFPAGDAAFRLGLRELGYIEGKSIIIEWRYGEGKPDRLREMLNELIRSNVAVIVTGGPSATRLAKQSNRTIPIVMATDRDPVANGFVASLARPGGNITGVSTLAPEISGKQLEILKEVVARLFRVAVFGTSFSPGNAQRLKEVELAAAALGVKCQLIDILAADDVGPAFQKAAKGHADAVLQLSSTVFNSQRSAILQLAAKTRSPMIYPWPEFVEAGGLMSYGVQLVERHHRAATYVDKILKGTKPSDLPVEQPTKFEFIVNLRTAKQIGLTIPPNVLARADRVIR